MKSKLYLVFMLFLSSMLAFGQNPTSVLKVIPLENPSFEGVPSHSSVPKGWYDCGFPGESPPDIQPAPVFEVSKPPYDGRTYLGLVVRDNETWESIGQKLPTPLLADSCYTLSIFAARSNSYESVSRLTEQFANYVMPVVIRIFGGNRMSKKEELLVVSSPIVNTNWEEVLVSFIPKANYNHFIIEAYYVSNRDIAYNGNVLLDNVTLYKGCQSGRVGN